MTMNDKTDMSNKHLREWLFHSPSGVGVGVTNYLGVGSGVGTGANNFSGVDFLLSVFCCPSFLQPHRASLIKGANNIQRKNGIRDL
jgi:hypothetical protein